MEYLPDDFENVFLFPDVDPEPYLYEPEYTQEEIMQRRQERERQERERQERHTEQSAQSQTRCDSNWWCRCGGCQPMPTEMESFCCTEWDRVLPSMARDDQPEDATCVCDNQHFIAMLHPAVIEFFFRCDKVNWTKRPIPEGPDGQLSVE